MKQPEITESSGNVFLDLGFSEEEAAAALAKSKLVLIIQETMEKSGWTQEETARKIGMTQPQLYSMLRGGFRHISEATILGYVRRLGLDATNTVTGQAGEHEGEHGRLEVVGV